MKRFIPIVVIAIIVASCGEKRVCTYNETEVPCGYYDLYTQLSEIERQINATFEDDVYFPFEEEYALREQWNALYNAKKDSLTEAYNLVGQSQMLSMMVEMRIPELEYFMEQKAEREELKTFMSSLDIKAERVDTSFWGGDPEPTLIWTITNNSDRAFKTLQIDKNIVVDGKIVKSSSTTFFFVSDQITPAPAEGEDAIVKPGSTLVISFDVPSVGEIKPEITRIGFVEELQ